ncbi:MAG: DUF3772 domain-containing protein [Sulfitobacter sp.]
MFKLARICLILLTFLVILPPAGVAQSTPPATQNTAPDYGTWASVASRAENAVNAGTDTNAVFETLRARIAGFRTTFDTARNANSERIATLRNQIDALGAAPEEGATEDFDIANRRAELTTQLSQLQAPVQVAQEAFTRADGLVAEIDSIIRERQTQRLLSLGPSPLNPVNWPEAAKELGEALGEFGAERRVFSDARLMAIAQENLPLVLILTAVGSLLLARGRQWASRLGDMLRKFGGRGTGVWSFIVSLLRIGLPLAGLYALVEALFATGLPGRRGTELLNLLPLWGLLLLGFRWLAERLFSRSDDEAILLLQPERRAEARFYILLIALMLVLRGLAELLFSMSEFARASEAVIAFPMVAVLGLILFRFGQLLRGYAARANEDDPEAPPVGAGLARIIRMLGLAAQIVAVAAPVMAGIGYSAVGNALLYPTLFSLCLLGGVMTLQRFFGDLYGWISGQGNAARESLVAVLLSFVLVLAVAPVLALIWGARIADLQELWARFLRGFEVGDATISPTDFLTFAFVFMGGYFLTRLLQTALKTSVLPKTKIDMGARNALVSGVGYVGIFLAAVIAITAAGIDLSSLAIVAGALSVGIGFGLQNIVSNFVSGIILLIERPISEGDWIEVGGQHGYVRNISVRSTRIETFDRSDVIVPNADLVSGTVTNYTRGNTVGRVIIPVGVAYGTDTRVVEGILREAAESHPMVLLKPPPSVVFQGFGASSLDFEIRAILRDVNWMLTVKSEVNHLIAKRFMEEGIEIPFPQQDVWLRNPETLRHGADQKDPDADQPNKTDPTGDSGA